MKRRGSNGREETPPPRVDFGVPRFWMDLGMISGSLCKTCGLRLRHFKSCGLRLVLEEKNTKLRMLL